jgi:hypothetical protein
MTRAELDKLTKIRDDAKGSFWDFDKWRVMARLDQFISDAAHELEQAEVASTGGCGAPSEARSLPNSSGAP